VLILYLHFISPGMTSIKTPLLSIIVVFFSLTAISQTKSKKPIARKSTAVVKKTTSALIPKNTLDSASYAFGMAMATSLKGNGLTAVNYDFLMKGLKDEFAGNHLLISKDRSQVVITKAFTNANKGKFTANITEGATFLEHNKKIDGVMTTPSGLQYMVIKEGRGSKPLSTDTVLVNYKGTLLNGKQFDSSYDRNEPLSLELGHVIPGWTEGMQLMTKGSKYRFFIPYDLAYGERGAGQDIPPYSTLIFEIELLKINGK
jgi:FKBP-type peptidyl-prolyl cis-trans isomerase